MISDENVNTNKVIRNIKIGKIRRNIKYFSLKFI